MATVERDQLRQAESVCLEGDKSCGFSREVRYTTHESAVSNPCPVIVPLASVAVLWLPPESRKWLKRMKGVRFKSYRPDQIAFGNA